MWKLFHIFNEGKLAARAVHKWCRGVNQTMHVENDKNLGMEDPPGNPMMFSLEHKRVVSLHIKIIFLLYPSYFTTIPYLH